MKTTKGRARAEKREVTLVDWASIVHANLISARLDLRPIRYPRTFNIAFSGSCHTCPATDASERRPPCRSRCAGPIASLSLLHITPQKALGMSEPTSSSMPPPSPTQTPQTPQTAVVYESYNLDRPPNHPGPGWTRFVCVSDNHSVAFKVPDGDVLLHAGDLSRHGTLKDLEITLKWLKKLPHPAKLSVALAVPITSASHACCSALLLETTTSVSLGSSDTCSLTPILAMP